MRIGADEALSLFGADEERWLYVLSDLSDPVRRTGISVYRRGGGFAILSDFAEETTVRLYAADPELVREVSRDPLAGPGTRFCFCGGFPFGGTPVRLGPLTLKKRDGVRTLERYGLFGSQEKPCSADPPPGFFLTEDADPSYPDTRPWRAFLAGMDERGPGDRIWIAQNADGLAAGYLWCAEAGDGWYDIVNLFVSPEYRRAGIGRALVSRFARESEKAGRRPYYGYALSAESAALAESAGFRKIYGKTVSLFAEAEGSDGMKG